MISIVINLLAITGEFYGIISSITRVFLVLLVNQRILHNLWWTSSDLNIDGWLVVSTYPSEKYEFVSWDDDIPNMMGKNKTCSKPPLSHFLVRATSQQRYPSWVNLTKAGDQSPFKSFQWMNVRQRVHSLRLSSKSKWNATGFKQPDNSW